MWRQKATAAVMSSPATTTAPDQVPPLPVPLPRRPLRGPTRPVGEPGALQGEGHLGGEVGGKQRRASIGRAGPGSQQGQVAVELELGHLGLVVVPLGPLVADEPFEDVVAEGLGQQLGALHLVDGVVQAGRKRFDPL